jgi:predicted lipoprotein with Yx(FWY)xxD motif
MRLRASLWLGILAVAAAAAFAAYKASRPHVAVVAAFEVPMATPPGIVFRTAARGGRDFQPPQILFADDSGALLYSFDKGAEPGSAACDGDCAKGWTRAVPAPNAAATGNWSVIVHPDGAAQWAFDGKPLYRRMADAPALDAKPDAAKQKGSNPAWRAVAFDSRTAPNLPLGIQVRDLPTGGGQAFTDDGGFTLYAFDGGVDGSDCKNPACALRWKPAAAPEIARRVGDFTVEARDDGVRQWAYRGRSLYRFTGDLQPDDANGAGFDPRFQVALLRRYFMPDSVVIRHAPALGDILTTQAGMTLYARDRFIDADGHNFRTDHGSETTGRALGVMSCDVDCTSRWHPLAAPAGAMPSGYWDIFMRPDGTRQWAYKGYALYSFTGDRQPGEINGNESYALMPLGQDDPYATALAGAKTLEGNPTPPPRPGLGVGAMFWRAATP